MTKAAKPDNPFADKALLAPLYRLIESRHSKSRAGVLIHFAKSLFVSSSQTELASLPVKQVYGRVMRAWEFVQHRSNRSPKIEFCSNDDACEQIIEHGTIIQILINNMPFLVDSVSQELTGKGIGINSIYNAVLHCERNAFRRGAKESRGKLTKLSPTQTPGNYAEALIIIHTSWLSEAQCTDLRKSILDILKHVAIAVSDYPAMCARALEVRQYLLNAEVPVSEEEREESCEFIQWLVDNNFTFLGYERFTITSAGKSKRVNLDTDSILGISRFKSTLRKSVSIKDEPGGTGELILRRQICEFAKSSSRSKVHRPGYYDYVLIKEFDSRGNVSIEHRFLGLYTSSVYFQIASEIPLVRKKVRRVLDRSGFSPNGHSIKGLFQVINVLPRDELFQVTSDQLFHTAMRITQIHERRRVRLFVRKDSYGKFFSCLIFIPRDNYNTRVREQIQDFLMAELRGVELDFSAQYSESILARLHFIIHSPQIEKVKFDRQDLEKRLVALVKPWDDELFEVLQANYPEQKAHQLLIEFGECFPISYREEYPAAEGVADIPALQLALATSNLALDFSISESGQPAFKVFRPGRQLVLSEVVPVLENLGLWVLRERNFCFKKNTQNIVWLHDYNLQLAGSTGLDEAKVKHRFEQAFEAIWCGYTENDRFNALVLISTLAWREVSLLRAYSAYMKQILASYSQVFIAETLINHAEIAEMLVDYFFTRFHPADRNRHNKGLAGIESKIIQAIDGVANLAEDTVLRLYFKLILATRRTNYFQQDKLGNSKAYIAFKFMPREIEEIPLPRPQFEIFVYAPQMEGVHLRGGSVARGGLRWSDRKEDFRTEVLGLVKAQQVKNSVIVPVGAKGGFVVKESTDGLSQDEFLSKGQACYRMFISGLLDLTDNIVAGGIKYPDQTVRWDDDDPYLVVAADKGTATFSDIANTVAAEYGFWLGDAFASGGSNGYDHKKMGITARGAWVSVQRHFRELEIDVQRQDITVLGIGDMSGDVFGNGMLLSQHIRLVGAFNHQHIFVDPDPDPASSFRERRRLFNRVRSSWADYKTELLSPGGGIFDRSAKSISICDQMKARFGIEANQLSPDKLIAELLCSSVDLIWNGGIGTYIKASSESNAEIGDKANDALRINGNELRCRVVGEGGNLGLTQKGRIEYALSGGIVLTDFIDNSAGVDCSDHEVNIKILLNELVASGAMNKTSRNELMREMTDEVARLVLKNNYRQVQAISMAQHTAMTRMSELGELIKFLEARAGLDRSLEYLPTDDELADRISKDSSLTRPELAVLTSYVKMYLKSELVKTDFIEDEYLAPYLYSAFPQVLVAEYESQVLEHRLRREITATQLANNIVNLVGPSFVYRKIEYTGASPGDVIKAAVVAKELFAIDEKLEAIEALDYQVSADMQQIMIQRLMQLMRRVTRWILRNRRGQLQMGATVADFSTVIRQTESLLLDALPAGLRDHFEQTRNEYTESGVPGSLASRIASVGYIYPTLAIVEICKNTAVSPKTALEVYFTLGDHLQITAIRQLINDLGVANSWQALARKSFQDDLDWQQRALTQNVIDTMAGRKNVKAAVAEWCDSHAEQVARAQQMVNSIQLGGKSDYAMFSVVLRELLNLAQSSASYHD